MALLRHAAPAPAKVHLPSLFIGSQNILAPKPTAPSFFNAPNNTVPTAAPGAAQPTYTTNQSTATPSSTSAPAATPGATSVGDFTDALANDPTLKSQLGVIDAQDVANTTFMGNAARRAAINFGGIPVLDPATAALAGLDQATLEKFGLSLPWDAATQQAAALGTTTGVSTMGRDNKAYADAQSAFLSSLAARGMLRSGALNQRGQESLLAYQQQVYQDTQALGDYLIGLWQQWLTQRSAGDAAKADATKTALDRIIAAIAARNAAAQAEHDRQASIGFTGVPGVDPNTGFGIPADPNTPRDFGSGTDVNPRFVSIAEQGTPTDPAPNLPQPPAYWTDYPPMSFDPAPSYFNSGGQQFFQSNNGPFGSKPLL